MMDVMPHQDHGNGDAAESIQFKDSLCRTMDGRCDVDGPRKLLQWMEGSCGRIASQVLIAAYSSHARHWETPSYGKTSIESIVSYGAIRDNERNLRRAARQINYE